MQFGSLLLRHDKDIIEPEHQLIHHMTQLSKRHRLTVELRLLIVLLLVELVLNILDRVHVHEVAEAGVVH